MPETLPQLAIKAKALAYRNRSRRNWVWLGGILSGVVAGGLWLIFFPDTVANPKTIVAVFIALGLVAAGLTLQLVQKTFPPETAKCPSCRYSWELAEGRYVPLTERMETWDKCPSCGFPMSDFMLERYMTNSDSSDLSLEQRISLAARFESDIFCGWFMRDTNEGISVSPRTTRMLAERNIKLSVDIHAPLADEPQIT